MDGFYYQAIGAILLVPWSLVGLTTAGYLRDRCRRMAACPLRRKIRRTT